MTKTTVRLVGALLALGAVLASCGSGAPSGTAASAGGKVTLTYWMWDKNYQPAIQKILDNFEASHPNIAVTLELTPWDQYWNKLDATATGGLLPDLFWMNGPNAMKYIANDMILPLDELTKNGSLDLGNYPKGLMALYNVGGVQYGVPFEMATIGLWYNKTLFQQAKLAFPDGTWDWAKLRAAAAQLTDKKKGIWGIGAPQKNEEGYYDTIVQNGGYIISPDKKKSGYDQPEAIEGLKFWTDLIQAKLSPTAGQMVQTDAVKLFESGKIAMLYDGSWAVGEFANTDYTKANVDVAPLPKGKLDTQVIHGVANAVYAKTNHKEAALELLAYLSSKEANDTFASFGSGIPTFVGTQDAWVKSVPEFHLQTFIDAAAAAQPYPVSKYTAKWLALEDQFLTKAWYGQTSTEEAAHQLAQGMNALLAQE